MTAHTATIAITKLRKSLFILVSTKSHIPLSEYEPQYTQHSHIAQGEYELLVVEWWSMEKAAKFDMERFFRALADRTRLRLLNLLGDNEVCVCFLVEILQTNQPNISRHLAYLKRAGIVTTRREGKWMHYRIASPSNPDAARVFDDVRRILASDKGMQRDRKRLVNVCCASELPMPLQIAPRPASLVSV